MKEKGLTFKDVIDAYQNEKVSDLVEKAPLAEAILGMVVKHHPPPHVAVKYRIPKIWKDRKSTRLNSSHKPISYAVFCLKKKIKNTKKQQKKQKHTPIP